MEERKKVETPKFTDAQLDQMAKDMKAELQKMDKVRIRIPKDQRNKEDLVVPVGISGYIFQINRGESVEVPQTVADILEESGYLG